MLRGTNLHISIPKILFRAAVVKLLKSCAFVGDRMEGRNVSNILRDTQEHLKWKRTQTHKPD